ncbi:uncharacterized protein LOC143684874 [Tamandua tetradactyla]|uniref:uncharacterized protein LOC143684874 n=1 Tax=Tamandua tetradactyla TaxID=48850 RepID=UPI004053E9EA
MEKGVSATRLVSSGNFPECQEVFRSLLKGKLSKLIRNEMGAQRSSGQSQLQRCMVEAAKEVESWTYKIPRAKLCFGQMNQATILLLERASVVYILVLFRRCNAR